MSRIKQIVGLDIGARNARAVWAQQHGGRLKVVRVERIALPLDGEDNVELIRKWLAQIGLVNTFASFGISGVQLVFQPGRLPPDDPRTVEQVAKIELLRFNEMVGDSMKCAVAGHQWHEGQRQYLMTLARSAVVEESFSQAESINIRPADIIPRPVALYSGLMPFVAAAPCDLELTYPLLFADIGHNSTEIAVGTPKGILFARSFPVGGRHFTEAIASGGGVSIQQAENQKHRDASLERGAPFAEFLAPVARRWLGQFTAVLSGYRGVLSGAPFGIRAVILSGGGAALRGFRELIAESTKLDVRLASDFAPPSGRQDLLSFAVAFGLAATSLEIPGLPQVSLIPRNLRDEVVFREKKPYWIAAAVMGVLTLVVFTVGLIYSLRRETARLEAELDELRAREKIDKEIASIRARTEFLRKSAQPLKRLLIGGPMSRKMLSLVSNSLYPDDWVSLISDLSTYMRTDAPEEQEEKRLPKALRGGFYVPGFLVDTTLDNSDARSSADGVDRAPEAASFTSFIVEGYTPDMSLKSVKAMIARMKSDSMVKSVDLLSDDKVKPPAPLPPFPQEATMPEMRRFLIKVEVADEF